MKHSKSSRKWLDEHHSDHYVKKAQKEGYRSRAAFKLLEMNEKDHLFNKGMFVVDLGAAPGGWSMVARKQIGDKGRVIALDCLAMPSIAGVEFLQGDFTEEATLAELMRMIDNQPVDLVMSDMAPNMSGIAAADQARSMYLAELALDLVKQILRAKGTFLVKVFQGEDFDDYLRQLRTLFTTVKVRKPPASRARSSEVYLLAQGFKDIIR